MLMPQTCIGDLLASITKTFSEWLPLDRPAACDNVRPRPGGCLIALVNSLLLEAGSFSAREAGEIGTFALGHIQRTIG